MLPHAILNEDPYPIKAMIAYRFDPLMSIPDTNLTKKALDKLDLLVAIPHGVETMSYDIPGLVETSNNLATIASEGAEVVIGTSSRSSAPHSLQALRNRIRAAGELAGASVLENEQYPGWKPNLDSKLLATVKRVHQDVFGSEPELKAIHAGIGVAIVIDQDARRDGVFVPFFGRLASTTPTLARLALRTGAPVLPCCCTPDKEGSYRVIYGPEVETARTGDRDEDVLRATARYTEIIEGWVRHRPELWLWMHRRWKTRPPTDRLADRR